MLTQRDVLDPDAELGIWITTNPDEKTIMIRDTGVGMTREELTENLGTIAHSGARAFLQAAQNASTQGNTTPVSEIIGQFGVGFYSAFMVAEWIRVTSRSFQNEAEAFTWYSAGEDTYTLQPAEMKERGTLITIKLNAESEEFAQESRLREVIKKHSDFIPYPIYLGEEKTQINQRSALWRQSPREIKAEEYTEFYREFTLDFDPPLTYSHMVVDAPVQLYALLYIPKNPERNIFSPRKEDGLKLYARKVLIQEYSRDLLPEYFRFVQGVVDSEDLQLNVSRESIQSSRVMAQIRRALTGKVVDMLMKLATDKPEDAADGYAKFWEEYARFIKEGIATNRESLDTLSPLLRYHTLNHPDKLVSLDEYVQQFKPDQKKIYYLLGDDERSLSHSPHLDVFRHAGVDVLLMGDPLDSFTLMTLNAYKEYPLVNAAVEKPEVKPEEQPEPEQAEETLPEDKVNTLIERFKEILGERVSDVRSTDRLIDSPARLVDKEGSLNQEVQRVYQMLRQEYEVPQKVLEINPRHPILKQLSEQPAGSELNALVVELIYEDALLIEGLHPNPVSMIDRVQSLMKVALK